jgi:ubiquitin thioesterase OTU1
MRISVKNPKSGAKWTLQQVDPTASLEELYALVISVTGISNFELKVGFPPSKLGGSSVSDSIRNGDQILIFPSPDTLNSKSTHIVKSTLDTSAQSTLNTGSTTTIARNDISTNKDNIKSEKLQDGFLVIREMKDDNSCLFRSIAYVLERNVELHSKQRQIVRDYILEHPIEYPKVILGRDPIEYCNWITNLNSWGGGIELAIFSEYYKTGNFRNFYRIRNRFYRYIYIKSR